MKQRWSSFTLFIRGRHMQISTQKLRLISAAARLNIQFLAVGGAGRRGFQRAFFLARVSGSSFRPSERG